MQPLTTAFPSLPVQSPQHTETPPVSHPHCSPAPLSDSPLSRTLSSHSHSTSPCAGNLQITLAYTWYSGQARGWGEGKKKKKYEKQFDNNNDADDKINYAQGMLDEEKRKRGGLNSSRSLNLIPKRWRISGAI